MKTSVSRTLKNCHKQTMGSMQAKISSNKPYVRMPYAYVYHSVRYSIRYISPAAKSQPYQSQSCHIVSIGERLWSRCAYNIIPCYDSASYLTVNSNHMML